jgi:chloride channel protein, CIC family
MAHALAPHLGGGTLLPVLATAGMAGVFAASIRAPLTGLVLVVELTHQGHLLLAQATAALGAYLFAAAVRERPVYEALRERDAQRETSR